MLRALFINDEPPHEYFDFQQVVSVLKETGFDVRIAWWITKFEDWTKVSPDLHQWLITAKQAQEYLPDLVVIDGDPTRGKIPESLANGLQGSGTVFAYIRAFPKEWGRDRQKTATAFAQAGFPLAINKAATKRPEEVGYLATRPNTSTVILKDVSFPNGVFGKQDKALTFEQLETHRAYILCPEEGGFFPLLVAPKWYDAKDPVWQYGDTFGLANKPYCFAGYRLRPSISILFACDMFSDRNIEAAENQRFFTSMLNEIVLHLVKHRA